MSGHWPLSSFALAWAPFVVVLHSGDQKTAIDCVNALSGLGQSRYFGAAPINVSLSAWTMVENSRSQVQEVGPGVIIYLPLFAEDGAAMLRLEGTKNSLLLSGRSSVKAKIPEKVFRAAVAGTLTMPQPFAPSVPEADRGWFLLDGDSSGLVPQAFDINDTNDTTSFDSPSLTEAVSNLRALASERAANAKDVAVFGLPGTPDEFISVFEQASGEEEKYAPRSSKQKKQNPRWVALPRGGTREAKHCCQAADI